MPVEQVFEAYLAKYSVPAAADLTTKRGCVITPAGALAATAGTGGYILLNSPDAGELAEYAIFGIAIGLAGGSISKGNPVTNAVTTGRLIAAVTSGYKIIGRAMTDAGDGEWVSILVAPGYTASVPA